MLTIDTGDIYLYFYDMQDLNINSCIHHHCAPDWRIDWSWEDYTFWHTTSGFCTMTSQNTLHRTDPEHSFIWEPGVFFEGRHAPETPLSVVVIHFNSHENPIPFEPNRAYRNHDALFIRKIVGRIMENWLRNDTGAAGKWFTMLVHTLVGSSPPLASLTEQPFSPNRDQQRQIDSLCSVIQHNPSHTFSVSEMAKQLYVSPDHFTRLFKSHTGASPKEYAISVRIQHARGLLLSSSHNMERIAELCGYKNLFFFSRQFKKKTGIAPSQYRKQH
jgi:AraC family transcriptional regulator, arabinose operon regulatory protein